MINKLCILLLGFLILPQNAGASQTCDSVRISAHPNYPPFHWREKRALTGASIAVSTEIFKRLGLKVTARYQGPWKRVLRTAQTGKLDFIPALKKNDERSQYLTFTETEFAANPVAVFVRKGTFDKVKSLNDFKGKFGSINAGDKHGVEIDNFVSRQQNMQHIHGLSQNFDMLAMARVDYFITGLYVGVDHISAKNLKGKFDIALQIDGPVVHNAFSKQFAEQCPHVILAFEQELKAFKTQGKVSEALVHYNELWLNKNKCSM